MFQKKTALVGIICGFKFSLASARLSSPADEGQRDHNQKYQAEAAAGIITPVGAVGPGRQRPEQQDDKKHEQDKSHADDSNAKSAAPKWGLSLPDF
jgi:hypothetical protein